MTTPKREGADIVGQSYGGFVSTIGNDGEPVTLGGALVADHCGARRTSRPGSWPPCSPGSGPGRGQRVDVSLLGGQIWLQASEYTHYFMTGELAGRSNGGHPLVHALYGVFPTADGATSPSPAAPSTCGPACARPSSGPTWSTHPRFNSPTS